MMKPTLKITLIESDIRKFERSFLVTPGCWIYKKGKDLDGYGQFRAAGKNLRAHRFSYTLYVGEIPHGMVVCHSCDNPSCVNPDHLWAGTNKENTHDKFRKGRAVITHGEKHWSSKLTESDVLQIRQMTGNRDEIARKFGVTRRLIEQINARNIWKHLP